MLIALRFNLRVDYNIELPQNKAKTSIAATSKAEASSSFKGFGFFKTLNTTWFNRDDSIGCSCESEQLQQNLKKHRTKLHSMM